MKLIEMTVDVLLASAELNCGKRIQDGDVAALSHRLRRDGTNGYE